jgi:hypothetical protein
MAAMLGLDPSSIAMNNGEFFVIVSATSLILEHLLDVKDA